MTNYPYFIKFENRWFFQHAFDNDVLRAEYCLLVGNGKIICMEDDIPF